MTVHLYAISWNEGAMMRFFLRHYEPIVDRFIVFDDHSTDGAAEIPRSHPKVELRTFRRRVRESLVLSMLAIYDEAWKESRGGDPALLPWSSHDVPRWWRTPPADRLRGFPWRLWRRRMALRSVLL